MNSETLSRVKSNVYYSNHWWASTIKYTTFFSYSERFHAETALKLLRGIRIDGNVLDVGMGSGLLIGKLHTKVHQFIGMDISLLNIKLIRRLYKKDHSITPLPVDPFQSVLPLKSECFDIVFCNHVLEHVPDDSLLLKEIHRVLRPGGYAVFMVPINEENIEVPTHVRKYSEQSITNLIRSQFKIVKSGSNDLVSSYIRKYGVKKKIIYTTLKRILIFTCSFVPSHFAFYIDQFLLKRIRNKGARSQCFILSRKPPQ